MNLENTNLDSIKTSNILFAFCVGWTKTWTNHQNQTELSKSDDGDVFKCYVINQVQGKTQEQNNKALAEQFGVVVTKVKAFPTNGNTKWIILDKHTKHVLHKDIPNEPEVNSLCAKHNYVRV